MSKAKLSPASAIMSKANTILKVTMSKIIKVSPGANGHLPTWMSKAKFADHEHHELKVGDNWPASAAKIMSKANTILKGK
jgi:hypothetical protein